MDIWPENADAVALFVQLQTQWRIGMSGPTGLDYNVLYHKLDRRALTPEQYEQLEDDIRTMEYETLSVLGEQSKESK